MPLAACTKPPAFRNAFDVPSANQCCCAAACKGMNPAPPKNGRTYSEEDWNETSTVDKEAYWLSKVGVVYPPPHSIQSIMAGADICLASLAGQQGAMSYDPYSFQADWPVLGWLTQLVCITV